MPPYVPGVIWGVRVTSKASKEADCVSLLDKGHPCLSHSGTRFFTTQRASLTNFVPVTMIKFSRKFQGEKSL